MITYYRDVFFVLILLNPFQLFGQQKLLASNSNTAVCDNYINISGNTNVNRFQFDFEFSRPVKFVVENKFNIVDENESIFEIPIPVRNFRSDNQLIYHDFLTLLKAEEYPRIIIGISYPQLNDFLTGISSSAVPQIRITIAGVSRTYRVPCFVSSCTGREVYVTGIRGIRLSDFNLDPPEKFQGLIKVKDEVIINFGFVFSFQNNS